MSNSKEAILGAVDDGTEYRLQPYKPASREGGLYGEAVEEKSVKMMMRSRCSETHPVDRISSLRHLGIPAGAARAASSS